MNLRECPFCGNKEVRTKVGHNDITFFLCDGCGAVVSFAPFKMGDKARESYNKRHTDDNYDSKQS